MIQIKMNQPSDWSILDCSSILKQGFTDILRFRQKLYFYSQQNIIDHSSYVSTKNIIDYLIWAWLQKKLENITKAYFYRYVPANKKRDKGSFDILDTENDILSNYCNEQEQTGAE